MLLAQVTGEIVSTINHPDLDRRRLLVCDRLDPAGQPTGAYLIAVATVEAGVGDRVLIVDEGTGARQVLASPKAPIRSVIVGIIDAVDISS